MSLALPLFTSWLQTAHPLVVSATLGMALFAAVHGLEALLARRERQREEQGGGDA